MWPNYLILWVLINATMSDSLIRRSSSALIHMLQIFSSVRSGPNIFLKICLSNRRDLFLSCSLRVHVSDAYVSTGLKRVKCIPIFYCILTISIIRVLLLHNMLCFLCKFIIVN
jgi:hypothetical protein